MRIVLIYIQSDERLNLPAPRYSSVRELAEVGSQEDPVKRKFIVVKDDDGQSSLMMGFAHSHKEMVLESFFCLGFRYQEATGGGYWEYSPDESALVFFGESIDFGRYDQEQLSAANLQETFNMNIVFR